MDGEAVDAVVDLTKKTLSLEVDGNTYSIHDLKHVHYDPQPSPVSFSTLTALQDFVNGNVDGFEKGSMFAIVDSPESVTVIRKAGGVENKRLVLASASLDRNLKVFPFSEYLSHQDLTIKLYTMFEESEDLVELRTIVSTLKAEKVIESETQGIGQKVTVAQGVSGAKRTELPPIMKLAPYRTFRELDQPLSLFIVRAKNGGDSEPPRVALFEADGGAWRIDAVKAIKNWIVEHIPGLPVMA